MADADALAAAATDVDHAANPTRDGAGGPTAPETPEEGHTADAAAVENTTGTGRLPVNTTALEWTSAPAAPLTPRPGPGAESLMRLGPGPSPSAHAKPTISTRITRILLWARHTRAPRPGPDPRPAHGPARAPGPAASPGAIRPAVTTYESSMGCFLFVFSV